MKKNRLDKIAYELYTIKCYNLHHGRPGWEFNQFVEWHNTDSNNCQPYYKQALMRLRKEKLKKLSNITS
jgi:hypothetical protein